MISDLAIYICLNMTTCELMVECFAWMSARGNARPVEWLVTWFIFAIAGLMLGFYVGQWITINL